MSSLSNLQPQVVWDIFQELCEIPRPSGKEEKIAQFVKKFGEDLGLETIMDDVNNVIIRKPATPGMENQKMVILQGHLDMVPQKNKDKQHDFEKDPIEAYVDGEWVTANGTTLGADNGIGLAMMLAILQSNDIPHGPIEALFTVDEESGMTGAFNVKPGMLKGEILLNLDTELDNEIYIGCAGGMNTVMYLPYQNEKTPEDYVAYKIEVRGLRGGHSGADIHLGRGNSNKILNRVLWEANKKYLIRVCDIEGGNVPNAIPRESFCSVVVAADDEEPFLEFIHQMEQMIKSELEKVDPDLSIEISSMDKPDMMMDIETHHYLLDAVYACPNGVMGMTADMPDLVETSTNLASIKLENNAIKIVTSQRSSVDSLKIDVGNMIESVFDLAGAQIEHSEGYPGWKPNLDTPIVKVVDEVYSELFHEKAKIKAIHAGLECALFGKVYPELEMVSIGPTLLHPHSPDEKVNIQSVKKIWDLLLQVLKHIPEQG